LKTLIDGLLPYIPHSLESERALIGALILDNAAIKALNVARDSDFYLPEHKTLVRRIVALHDDGTPIDLVSLTDALRENGEIDRVGGASYVSSLIDGVPKISNADYYAIRIKKHSCHRQMMAIASEIRYQPQDPTFLALALDRWNHLLAELQNLGTGHSLSEFQLTPLKDLLIEPEEKVEWVLENRLPTGGISILAGKPKAGKSTFARCLALAISRGEKFLGSQTQAGTVVYLALEEKRSEVKRHFRQMGAQGSEPILVHCAAAPKNAIDVVEQLASKHNPVLIIIDPLLRLARMKDGNDYAEVTKAMEPLISIARTSGAHILAVHHLGKGNRPDPSEGILGSTAFLASVDTALLFKRTERHRTIYSLQRYGEDLAEHVLDYDTEKHLVSLGALTSEVDGARIASAIVVHLEECGEQLEEDISDAVEGRNSLKRKALRSLVKEGVVVRGGAGRRNDPYRYSKAIIPVSRS
jgi:hypothetical protein